MTATTSVATRSPSNPHTTLPDATEVTDKIVSPDGLQVWDGVQWNPISSEPGPDTSTEVQAEIAHATTADASHRYWAYAIAALAALVLVVSIATKDFGSDGQPTTSAGDMAAVTPSLQDRQLCADSVYLWNRTTLLSELSRLMPVLKECLAAKVIRPDQMVIMGGYHPDAAYLEAAKREAAALSQSQPEQTSEPEPAPEPWTPKPIDRRESTTGWPSYEYDGPADYDICRSYYPFAEYGLELDEMKRIEAGTEAKEGSDVWYTVSSVQAALRALNYGDPDPLPITGNFGPLTEASVASFQDRFSLAVTGDIDASLWDAIRARFDVLERCPES